MKKLYIFILMFLASSASLMAQSSEGFDKMILKFTDGSTEDFSLSEDVVMIPAFDHLIIKQGGVEYYYNRAELQSIVYHETYAGIEDIVVDEDSDVHVNDGAVLSINNIYNDHPIEVYTTDGRLVSTFQVTPNTNHVNLSHLSHGIYLVKRGNETHKIVLR